MAGKKAGKNVLVVDVLYVRMSEILKTKAISMALEKGITLQKFAATAFENYLKKLKGKKNYNG